MRHDTLEILIKSIAEGKYLDKQQPVTTTFDELADAYWRWICPNEAAGVPARKRSWKSSDRYALGRLRAYFGAQPLTAITPALVEQYRAWRRATVSRHITVIRIKLNVPSRSAAAAIAARDGLL